mmetsp:Transcript_94225/g.304974  ORF Transcript_94225/g.304974 Transcript_94225/m.304974 type:complete len:99 (-) Transcript_94225:274-570(-)
MRQRQMMLDTQKRGGRLPRQTESELAEVEQSLLRLLPPVNRCFFQRFDSTQLHRFVRALPLLRVSQGRWIFGDECPREGSDRMHSQEATPPSSPLLEG